MEKPKQMGKAVLFNTGFLQVVLVSLNTYLIAKGSVAAVPVVSFLISFIWSHNVKRVAFGDEWDRVFYSTGAALGGLAGLLIGKMFM